MVRQAPGEEVSCLQPILVDRIFGFSLFNIIHIKVLKVWFCSLYSGQLRIYFLLLHFTNKKACLLPRRLFLSHIVSSLASHCWLQINKRFNNGESFSTHQLLLKILQRCKPYMYPHQQEQLLSLEVGPGTRVCVCPSTAVLSLGDHPHCCKLLDGGTDGLPSLLLCQPSHIFTVQLGTFVRMASAITLAPASPIWFPCKLSKRRRSQQCWHIELPQELPSPKSINLSCSAWKGSSYPALLHAKQEVWG